jgi:hypothetical protein
LNSSDEFLKALAFGVEDFAAERGETVITTAGVVEFGSGAVVGFLDEVGFNKALEGSVEGGGPEVDLAGGALEDFLHDAVAVLLFAGEGEKNMKPLGFEGEEGLEVGLVGHGWYIYRAVYIFVKRGIHSGL